MNLVLFTHPEFVGSQSQSRFAHMLAEAYRARGHVVDLRQPRPHLRRIFVRGAVAKWAGYVDQYIVFPLEIVQRARHDPPDTLYVFCDQALGPWVPRVADRPHVVHCHDLLALRSALGEIVENPTSWTGQIYQRYIRRGFRHGRHFISISNKTRDDLHRVGGVAATTSTVVYNGLNHAYTRLSQGDAEAALHAALLGMPRGPYLLHVGGGQWYKNTAGVLALYDELARLRTRGGQPIPALVMVSPQPPAAQRECIDSLPAGARVVFCPGVGTPVLQALYSLADALLFPSLAEGFGWPIVEALACGCPVVTTDEAPMNEVGGSVATYLPRLSSPIHLRDWARDGAGVIARLIDRPAQEREAASMAARDWARRYDAHQAIERYLDIYEKVWAATSTRALPDAVQARAQ